MAKLIITVKNADQKVHCWQEEYILNAIYTKAEAEAWASNLIREFNEQEKLRYGKKAALRELLSVEIDGADNRRKHEWAKVNAATMTTPRKRLYDLWRCKVCGITGRRYGLSGVIERDKAYKAKKYDLCNPGHS